MKKIIVFFLIVAACIALSAKAGSMIAELSNSNHYVPYVIDPKTAAKNMSFVGLFIGFAFGGLYLGKGH